MKKFFLQTGALSLIAIVALLYQTGKIPFLTPSTSPLISIPAEPVKKAEVVIKDTEVEVEIADTPDKRAVGLGDKRNLASDSGMLFVFPEESIYSFWMKGLAFPLDFLWIRDNKVVDLTLNVPPQAPGQPDEELPIYQPKEPVDQVLEVHAGFVEKNGVVIGDMIQVNQ